jgi:peptidylprolyl isomerase
VSVTSRPPASVRPRRGWRVALPLAVALVVAGCGGGADDAQPDEPAATEIEVDLEAEPDPATYLDEDRGEPPTELVVEDLMVGDGAEATAGDVVRVDYVGVDWGSGQEFDSSWSRGTPFDFQLGVGQVIPGWDQGVEGMRVGGRRVLTIPPDLAYGDQSVGDVIGPDATLVFVVDLLEVDGEAD